MKIMNAVKESFKKEKGSLIVEATIVFPVMFLIVIFLIFLGNIYYQRSRAQAVFTNAVIEYAARESNPMLKQYMDSGSLGAVSTGNDFKPYRYSNFSSRGAEIGSNVEGELGKMGGGLFSSMEYENPSVSVKYKTYGIYAKAEAEMTYSITMPVKLLGQSEATKVDFEEYIEVPAMEGAEMVRNVNMIRDLVDRHETASNMASKAGEFLGKFRAIMD